jgi:hypothetical protein
MKTLRVDELHQINMICHSMARIMSVICDNRAAAYLCEARRLREISKFEAATVSTPQCLGVIPKAAI